MNSRAGIAPEPVLRTKDLDYVHPELMKGIHQVRFTNDGSLVGHNGHALSF